MATKWFMFEKEQQKLDKSHKYKTSKKHKTFSFKGVSVSTVLY